ncbi:MAG: hypothetical protein ACYC2T_08315 [Bacillota bacterium]
MHNRLPVLVLIVGLWLWGLGDTVNATWVSGEGEAASGIASQGLNYFGDASSLNDVQVSDSELYQSLQATAGSLFYGYQDTTARINETISNRDAALILARNYGYDTSGKSGDWAMNQLGISGGATDPFDLSQVSTVSTSMASQGRDSQFDLVILSGSGSGSITRGNFLRLNFPQQETPPPPPPEDPGYVWDPDPYVPVYYPPADVRSFTATLEQPTVRPGNAFAVKAAIVGEAVNVFVTVPWGNYPMQRQGGEWRAYVPVPSSHAGGAYPVKASAVIQQPPDYLDWKPFQQEFTVMISNAPEPEEPLPSNFDDLPDWWTPPWMQDWYSGY